MIYLPLPINKFLIVNDNSSIHLPFMEQGIEILISQKKSRDLSLAYKKVYINL